MMSVGVVGMLSRETRGASCRVNRGPRNSPTRGLALPVGHATMVHAGRMEAVDGVTVREAVPTDAFRRRPPCTSRTSAR